ncbi:MAG: GAF domain-containing sensor histidine kinase [Chloroflexota bacterium]
MSDNLSDILHQPERLHKLRILDLIDKSEDISFSHLTRLAKEILDVPIVLVTFIESERQVFRSQIGLSEPWASTNETPLSHSFCQHTLGTNEPLVINDAREHPLVKDNLAITDLNVIAYLGMPLSTVDGFALGSFCIIDTKPRNWTKKDIHIMQDLVGAVMTEIKLREELYYHRETQLELKRQKEDIDKALITEKELNLLKSRFMSMVSHEFRTPLAVIQSSIDLLDRYGDLYSKQKRIDAFAKIRRQIERLTYLVSNTMTISRTNDIGFDFSPQEIDILELSKEIATEVKVSNPSPLPISITSCSTREANVVAIDEHLFRHILQNLLENALKYSGSTSEPVKLSLAISDQFLTIRVSDSGIGIPRDVEPTIFEAFVRANNADNIAGTGLGLAIVKKAVEQHAGTINFRTHEGKGTTFIVNLPIA